MKDESSPAPRTAISSRQQLRLQFAAYHTCYHCLTIVWLIRCGAAEIGLFYVNIGMD